MCKRVEVLSVCQDLNAIGCEHIEALTGLCHCLSNACAFVNVYKVVRRPAEPDLFRIVHYVRAMLTVDALDERPAVIAGGPTDD